jgi:hypothetical protein
MRLKLAVLGMMLVCSVGVAHADAIQQDILWTTPLTTTVGIGEGQPPYGGGYWITTSEAGPFGPVAPGDQFFLSANDPVIAGIIQYLDACGPGGPCGDYPNDIEIVIDPRGPVCSPYGPLSAACMVENDGNCPGLVCSFGNYYLGDQPNDPGPGSVIDGVVIDVTSNSVEYGVYGTGLLPTNTPEPPSILLSGIGILGLLGVAWCQNRRAHLVPKSVY